MGWGWWRERVCGMRMGGREGREGKWKGEAEGGGERQAERTGGRGRSVQVWPRKIGPNNRSPHQWPFPPIPVGKYISLAPPPLPEITILLSPVPPPPPHRVRVQIFKITILPSISLVNSASLTWTPPEQYRNYLNTFDKLYNLDSKDKHTPSPTLISTIISTCNEAKKQNTTFTMYSCVNQPRGCRGRVNTFGGRCDSCRVSSRQALPGTSLSFLWGRLFLLLHRYWRFFQQLNLRRPSAFSTPKLYRKPSIDFSSLQSTFPEYESR